MVALMGQSIVLTALCVAMLGDPPPPPPPPPPPSPSPSSSSPSLSGKDYSGSCLASGCHADLTERKVVHDAANDDDGCSNCHKPTGKDHKFELTSAKDKLCLTCHDQFDGAILHKPVADGKCLTCHNPHGTDSAFLLRAPTSGELCAKCHSNVTVDRKFLHGPVAAGACTACHDAHSSDHPALLPEPEPALCLQCHETMNRKLTDSAVVHAPVTEQCLSCHDPHGAANRMNLKSSPPGLCLDCHDGIADIIDESRVQHDAVTKGRACPQCHQPHASPNEFLLAQAPMDLCLSCHNKPIKSDDGKLTNIAALLAANPDHHGPIREKNCTACHVDIHGGDRFRLLLADYPPEFYAPFEESRYALCFKCHESDVVRDEQTDKLTNFRNGDRNLHFLHVHRKIKGRTCRACHQTHASKKPKHITESVPFGSWKIPINFSKTDTGGSCQPGCHKRYRYDRDKPATNLPQG